MWQGLKACCHCSFGRSSSNLFLTGHQNQLSNWLSILNLTFLIVKVKTVVPGSNPYIELNCSVWEVKYIPWSSLDEGLQMGCSDPCCVSGPLGFIRLWQPILPLASGHFQSPAWWLLKCSLKCSFQVAASQQWQFPVGSWLILEEWVWFWQSFAYPCGAANGLVTRRSWSNNSSVYVW